ncbi:MAG: stage III sporulation protein AD [Firmicutes bacterium]|nr:stage III sporulation protein AD [Bacillota bacterium]HQD40593.1 stage III sporulation protein AD [Bacillota bacterium]
MSIVQVVVLGLVAAFFATVLRQTKPELAIPLGLVAGVLIFLNLLPELGTALGFLSQLSGRAGLDPLYLGLVVKTTGIAYLGSFGAQTCRDMGEGALADKIELATKVIIMILALPVLGGILGLVEQLLP